MTINRTKGKKAPNLEPLIAVYRDAFSAHGDSTLSTAQNNRETQYLRFRHLLRQIMPLDENVSIHDVGSGLCDLHQYLNDLGLKHLYSGTELVPEMINESKKKFPGITLFERDLLSANESERYDYLVLSGTLNIAPEISKDEWKQHSIDVISKMFEMCNRGISFNFLTTFKTKPDANNLHYFNPCELFEFCARNLSRFTILDHGYPLYEGTITVLRKDYLSGLFDPKLFGKYF